MFFSPLPSEDYIFPLPGHTKVHGVIFLLLFRYRYISTDHPLAGDCQPYNTLLLVIVW
jgi:hypothetical protein